MALRNILADAVAATGYKINDDSQYIRILSLINDAADEIWKTFELPNCLGEQIFELGVSDQQISLPHYILEVKAIRDYDSELRMIPNDMRPRYGTMGWVHFVGRNWRIKQQEAPLGANLLNVEPLTFVLPAASPEDFSIGLEIRTPKAERTTETIVFAAGDVSQTSSNLIEEVYSITKDAYTTYDLSVRNQNGDELATLPNSELKTNYTVVNVLARLESTGVTKLVEVLFKRSFPKFRNDTDRFPCGDSYDKAIFYKAMEIFYGIQDGQDALTKALAFNAKCNDVMTKLTLRKESGIVKKMDFGPNRWRNLATRYYSARFAAGIRALNSW